MESAEEILIPVPWGHISGKTYGSPSGHKVLVVHGWTDNCGTFDLLAPLLSEKLYLVCIDLPGHGQSSHFPPGIPYHQIEYVVTIRRIIKNYLKWTSYDYVGHSLGAAIGSVYAAIFPSEVERLVMIDYVKMISWTDERVLFDYGTYSREFLALDRQRNGSIPVTPYPLSKLSQLYVLGTGGQLKEQEAEILLKRGARRLEPNADKWTLTRDVAIRNSGLMRWSDDAMLAILSSMRCKMLLIKAIDSEWEESEKLCSDTFNIYRANCKSYELVDAPGNHFIPLTNPSGIASHINRFLISDR